METLYCKSKPTKKKMKVNLVVCCDLAGNIGKQGGLPWTDHFVHDMKNFTNLTMGHGVVMGRKTWESLPERHRPLKGRRNYVVSSTLPMDAGLTCSVYPSLDVAVTGAALDGIRELWVIGGASLYNEVMQKLPLLSDLWVTVVNTVYPDCDAKFPLGALREAFPYGPATSIQYSTKNGLKYAINCFTN
jgi:dihydrofolate reductase